MKRFLTISLLAAIPLMVFAATKPLTTSRNYKIENTESNTVALTVQKPGTLATNALEVYSGSNLKFAIPETGHLPLAYGGTGTNSVAGAKYSLGIQAGTVTGTNVWKQTNSFAKTFSSAPVVVLTSDTNVLPHVISITASNFVWGAVETNKAIQYMAIGAP